MLRRPPLPTFLIIGAQKSATRWLLQNLGRHPDIYVAPLELEFFNNVSHFRKGARWYRKQFAGRSRRDRTLGWAGEPILGEATPGYMMWRHKPRAVAHRIKKLVPDVRLIAVLRNPVDRANSALVHHVRKGRLPRDADLLELVRAESPEEERFGLVAGGWYGASLKPYLHAFGDQLLVLVHDDVRDDPSGAYEAVLRHVGARPDFVPPELAQVVFSNQEGASSDWRRAISPEERWELYQYFRDDIRMLERMFGLDLSIWKPRRPVPGWSEPSAEEIARCFCLVRQWAEGVVRNVSPASYDRAASPANGTVRTLMNELIGGAHYFSAMLTGGDLWAGTPAEPPDLVADDPASQYHAAADTLQVALDNVGDRDGPVTTPLRRSVVPAPELAGQAVTNQLVVAWELASATDQDAPLPAGSVEVTSGFARRMVWGFPDSASSRDGDASRPVDRFVAFLEASASLR